MARKLQTIVLFILFIVFAGSIIANTGCSATRKTTSTTDTHSDTTSVQPRPH